MARKAKVATPVIETPVVEVKLSWMDRMLLSENGRKLARPMTDDEKRCATSGTLTGASMLIAGPVAGAIAAIAVTSVDTSSTKDNWRGVTGTAAGGIALAAAGVGALGAAIGGLATTAVGMIANRLRTQPAE